MNAQLLEDFARHLHRQGRSPGTLEQRVGDLRRLANTVGALVDLTRSDLDHYIDTATEHWAPAYRKRVYESYRIFFTWAKKKKLVTRNPTRALETVPVPRRLPRPAPEGVVLAAFDDATLAESAMLSLGACQGLRRSEIASAHPRNRDGDRLRVLGKGDKERVVPLDTLSLHLLIQLEAEQGTDDYYFPGRLGGHLHPATVYKWLKRHLGTDWSTHNLRHRAATLGLKKSGNLRGVQDLLGHASVSTTQVYTAVAVDELTDIVNATSLQRAIIERRLQQALIVTPTSENVQDQEVLAALATLSGYIREHGVDAA